MPIVEVTVPKYLCSRCGYEWFPRKPLEALPLTCPGCHSPYWNVERVYKVKVLARKVNKPAELPKHKPETKRKERA